MDIRRRSANHVDASRAAGRRGAEEGGMTSRGGPAASTTTRQEDSMNFVIYSDNNGRFHWRLDDDDGKPVAVSHAAFTSADSARRAAVEVHDHVGSASGPAGS
jgi:uncharacterized protein YegP (UPF0339 family)